MKIMTCIVGTLLCILRVIIGCTIQPESFALVQVFKDMAHLFMGGLCVALWIDQQKWKHILFWGMCVLEITVAVMSRMWWRV